jgi:hypothetical protein
MVWYGNASTCSSPSNHDDDDATQHSLSACACAYVVDEEEEEQELEQEEEGERGEVDNQPRPRSRRLFFHVGSGVHGNEANRHTNPTHPPRHHHRHRHCRSPISLFACFAAATPAPALDRTRVESCRGALHSSRDASRRDATRDDTRRYTPAALCNAIMQCNAMRSNPPRTARVSARGPDTSRWREQACARVDEAGMGIGMGTGDVMGIVRIPKSHVQK